MQRFGRLEYVRCIFVYLLIEIGKPSSITQEECFLFQIVPIVRCCISSRGLEFSFMPTSFVLCMLHCRSFASNMYARCCDIFSVELLKRILMFIFIILSSFLTDKCICYLYRVKRVMFL